MGSFDDFMLDATNCFTYRADRLATHIQQGGKDCVLRQQVNLMAVMLDTLVKNTEKQLLTSAHVESITRVFKRLCGDPDLTIIGNGLPAFTSSGIPNIPFSTSIESVGATIVSVNIYTVTNDDEILLVDTSLFPVQIIIPSQFVFEKHELIIKDMSGMADVNPISVTTSGTETIDGEDTYMIDHPYLAINLVSNGFNYYLV